jgi:hypothetical protein
MATATPEQPVFDFVADEAIRRCFEILGNDRPHNECGLLWNRLNATSRLLWLGVARLPDEICLKHWPEFPRETQNRLMYALTDICHFFQQAGQR